MSTLTSLTLAQILAAVDAAFAAALAQTPPQKVAAHQIGTNASLRTDLYAGPQGSGFLVVATVDLGWRSLVITRQHGPETGRELSLDRAALLEELAASYEKTVAAGVTVNGCLWNAEPTAQNNFANLALILREQQAARPEGEVEAFLAAPVQVADYNNAVHTLTVADYRAFLLAYGAAVQTLWQTYAMQRADLAA